MVNSLLKRSHLFEKLVKVSVWLSHFGRNLVEAVKHGLGVFDGKLNVSENGQALVKWWLLQQDANGVLRAQTRLTVAWSV